MWTYSARGSSTPCSAGRTRCPGGCRRCSGWSPSPASGTWPGAPAGRPRRSSWHMWRTAATSRTHECSPLAARWTPKPCSCQAACVQASAPPITDPQAGDQEGRRAVAHCEEAAAVLADVSLALHAHRSSDGAAARMPARASPLHHSGNYTQTRTVAIEQAPYAIWGAAGWQVQCARLCAMVAMPGASRLKAFATVADPGLAEVADGAHERHACGVASVRHAAVPAQTPAQV